jgi:hypothetical protein
MFDVCKLTPKGSMLVPNFIHEMPIVTPQKTGFLNRQFLEETYSYPHVHKYDPRFFQMKPWLKPGDLREDPGVDFMGFFDNNR